MDLLTIEAVARPRTRSAFPPFTAATAWLAGGTWLFSEPQPDLHTLVDLAELGWPALETSEAGLRIGATCTIATIEAFEAPTAWRAAPLFAGCANALLGSFKIWHTATVGGNVCLALPAAPMLALTVALDGMALVWRPDGSEYRLAMRDFALGPQRTALAAGDLLRAIDLPEVALRRRAVMRQISLTAHGRSAALVVGTLDPSGAFALTITGSTPHPIFQTWAEPPTRATLDNFVAGLPPESWYDDCHGAPDWRRHVTRLLTEELRQELTA